MAVSIVKVPSTASGDFDFLGFSFAGRHSWDDFGIYRTSDGDRYNDELAPPMQDLTAEVPGGDGQYYFGTFHKPKVFNVNFAFDNMSEVTYKEMKKWLNGKEMGDLWFEEAPYKVYTAKVTGTPQMKSLCFDAYNEETKKMERVYRGDGTIQFTAYWPYAHTPDKVQKKNGSTWTDVGDGKISASYNEFGNKDQWLEASGITGTFAQGDNKGTLPAHFLLKAPQTIDKSNQSSLVFRVGDLSITVPAASSSGSDNNITYTHYESIEWDSKTGIVSAMVLPTSTATEKKRKPIPFTGNSLGTIPANSTVTWGLQDGASSIVHSGYTLNYHYWYY